jgi:tetratricopeptide (TPR) repeat protein
MDFHVFLSHNSKDKPVVQKIAAALRAHGLNPWLDVDELRPGLPWQDALEEAMRTTQAAAVCVSGHGMGSWQKPEVRVCLSQMVERGQPVIPVLLPGAPDKPDLGLFLRENTWVDLRQGITEKGMDRLIWGITGKKPDRGPRPTPAGPPIHNLPFQPLGDLLKGRDHELASLEETLAAPGGAAAITQSEAISGLGGIGKTRLAVEHAWRCGSRYTAAWFVRADTPEGLHRGLAGLAGPDLLKLAELPTAEDQVVAAVLRHLREHPGWLLILDNVDTQEAATAVCDLLPRFSGGRVLITSRLREWPPSVRKQPLETLLPDEAVLFLIKRTDGEREPAADDATQAHHLAEILGGLPLALEQAAAYINHHRLRFADYRAAWEQEREAVLSWYEPRIMQYPASVAVTWKTTFDRLSPTAGAILRLTAFLAPDPMQVEMFEKGEEFVRKAAGLLAEERGKNPDPGSILSALAELGTYSMITRLEGRRLTVHRMVQEAMRSQIPEERRKDWIELSLRVVNWFSPPKPDDVRTWPVWDLLRPHATVIVAAADAVGITEPTSRLMNHLGQLLQAKGLFSEAEPLMRRSLDIGEASFGPEHPNVAASLNNLAQLLKATNRLDEAEPLMRRTLAIAEISFGPEHPNVATSLNNLALLLKNTNRLDEAEPLMRRALAIDEASFGPEHPNVAIRLNNLAGLLKATDRLDEAEPLRRRALAIDEASLGPEHPNVAIRLNNLAALLKATDRLDEAEPLMRRAAEILEKSLGPDHPRTKMYRRNLANLLAQRERETRPDLS